MSVSYSWDVQHFVVFRDSTESRSSMFVLLATPSCPFWIRLLITPLFSALRPSLSCVSESRCEIITAQAGQYGLSWLNPTVGNAILCYEQQLSNLSWAGCPMSAQSIGVH